MASQGLILIPITRRSGVIPPFRDRDISVHCARCMRFIQWQKGVAEASASALIACGCVRIPTSIYMYILTRKVICETCSTYTVCSGHRSFGEQKLVRISGYMDCSSCLKKKVFSLVAMMCGESFFTSLYICLLLTLLGHLFCNICIKDVGTIGGGDEPEILDECCREASGHYSAVLRFYRYVGLTSYLRYIGRRRQSHKSRTTIQSNRSNSSRPSQTPRTQST